MENGNNKSDMRVCGIIAEYDPFHQGHAWQIAQVKHQLGAKYIVCVISCGFSQRGTPAMFSTHARAKMALDGGADLVLGMPYAYGTAQANRFAMGGVGILHQLKVVTHLCFGVEEKAFPLLHRAKDHGLKDNPLVAQKLKAGVSAARAMGEALADMLPEAPTDTIQAPNFILGLCYLQALKDLDSGIQPWPIARKGQYHDTTLQMLPSATAVRSALVRGDWAGVQTSVPETTFAIIRKVALEGRLHHEEALDKVLLSRLLTTKPHHLHGVPEISEGLENRILSSIRDVTSGKELIAAIKTKRYTYARISRALSNVLMGLKEEDIPPTPPYARLLGFRREAEPLLKAIAPSGFPLISRPAKHLGTMLASDMLSEQYWALGAGLSFANAYREQVIIR